MSFNYQPIISGPTINLRPILQTDFDEYYQCASDPTIWAGHPSKDRYKLEVFTPYFAAAIKDKAIIVVSNDTNKIIGSSRYYTVDTAPNDISIGFTFLTVEYWGGGTNKELKQLMFDHAFKTYDNIWLHIDPANIRSQTATQRIGAKFIRDEVNNIGNAGLLWKCYCISKQEWELNQQHA